MDSAYMAIGGGDSLALKNRWSHLHFNTHSPTSWPSAPLGQPGKQISA